MGFESGMGSIIDQAEQQGKTKEKIKGILNNLLLKIKELLDINLNNENKEPSSEEKIEHNMQKSIELITGEVFIETENSILELLVSEENDDIIKEKLVGKINVFIVSLEGAVAGLSDISKTQDMVMSDIKKKIKYLEELAGVKLDK